MDVNFCFIFAFNDYVISKRAPVIYDDLSFAFCKKYLFYALPVRWQLLTGQRAKGPSVDDDLSFTFCEKYLFYALPVRWQSLTGQRAKGSSRR